MRSQFDQPTNRSGLNSIKWDKAGEIYGCSDLIPMWVADMDFPPPQSIIEALVSRAKRGFYGYEAVPSGYLESFAAWLHDRHDWDVPQEWITYSPGVVSGLSLALQTFTQPGDKIVIQPPVYQPFFSMVERNDRQVVENPLIVENGRYTIDFAELERLFQTGARTFIFCSPHNPVGRVWSREELEQLAALIIRYDVLTLTDEIWSDLTLPGHKHLSLAKVSSEVADRCITFMAPSKTFNLAGFYLSNVIIPNEELRRKYKMAKAKLGLAELNTFGAAGAEAAYRTGAQWLDELREYLQGNVDFVLDELAQRIPGIKVIPPEGTYLLWLDCRELPIKHDELNRFFAQKAGVAFNDGAMFGKQGAGFQRMNIACPRSTIAQALKQIEEALSQQ